MAQQTRDATPGAASRNAEDRIAWVDALRGLAVLAIIPLNARWILHPRDAYHDPSLQGWPDAIGWLWWAVPELLFDHSTLFALAAVFGISLSAARAADAEPGWARRHRARLILLGSIGFAHGALVWPGDILFPYAVTALLLTGAVRDTDATSNGLAWIALLTAAIPPALGLSLLYTVLSGYEAAGVDGHEVYVLATPDYRAWESGLYTAPLLQSLEVKWAQWSDQITETFGSATLWHAAAGMLAGVWWHRRGRRLTLNPALAEVLCVAGLALTTAALVLAVRGHYHAVALTIGNWITYAGGALLAAGAVVAFTNADPRRWNTPAGAWLRSCGRSSLSIYLLANLALAGIAQGWGLGLHGQLSADETAAATLAVIGVAAWYGKAQLATTRSRPRAEEAWRLGTRLLSGGPRRRRPPRT